MKLFDVLRPVVPFMWTDEELYDRISEGVKVNKNQTLTSPDDEVNESDQLTIGFTTWTAYDFGVSARKLLPTAEGTETEIVCPTCNGKGVVIDGET